jgi:hypothetical protein
MRGDADESEPVFIYGTVAQRVPQKQVLTAD